MTCCGRDTCLFQHVADMQMCRKQPFFFRTTKSRVLDPRAVVLDRPMCRSGCAVLRATGPFLRATAAGGPAAGAEATLGGHGEKARWPGWVRFCVFLYPCVYIYICAYDYTYTILILVTIMIIVIAITSIILNLTMIKVILIMVEHAITHVSIDSLRVVAINVCSILFQQ